MNDNFHRDYWPDQSLMRRRSHAIIRWTLITVSIVVAAGTLLEHDSWPRWLRYGMYGVVVFAVRRFIPRPDWPDDITDDETEAQGKEDR